MGTPGPLVMTVTTVKRTGYFRTVFSPLSLCRFDSWSGLRLTHGREDTLVWNALCFSCKLSIRVIPEPPLTSPLPATSGQKPGFHSPPPLKFSHLIFFQRSHVLSLVAETGKQRLVRTRGSFHAKGNFSLWGEMRCLLSSLTSHPKFPSVVRHFRDLTSDAASNSRVQGYKTLTPQKEP